MLLYHMNMIVCCSSFFKGQYKAEKVSQPIIIYSLEGGREGERGRARVRERESEREWRMATVYDINDDHAGDHH